MRQRDGEGEAGGERDGTMTHCKEPRVEETMAGERHMGDSGTVCGEQGFLNCSRILRSLRQKRLEY